jgi:hypothetical protein
MLISSGLRLELRMMEMEAFALGLTFIWGLDLEFVDGLEGFQRRLKFDYL